MCVLVDLFNCEIIGYRAGPHKDDALISRAFAQSRATCVRFSGSTQTVEVSLKIKIWTNC